MTAFPKYPKYKDSGLEWLGEVPEHWEMSRSRRVFTQRKELARKSDQQLSATQAYGVIPQADYEERIGRKVVKISMHLEKRKHVEPDDFVISMRSFQGGLERAWARGCIRSSYTVLEPAIKVAPSYFAYFFKCPQYIGALQSTGNFIRDGQDLTYQNYILVDLPLPPLVEQERIGAFLDEKTEQINTLIAKKQRQIELLDEQKAILINRAVTRDVPSAASAKEPDLRDSGLPWLPKFPISWSLVRFKSLDGGAGVTVQIGPFGGMIKDLASVPTGFKVYGQENTISADLEKGGRWLEAGRFRLLNDYAIKTDDILLTRKGSIGNAFRVPNEFVPGIIDSDTIRVRVSSSRLLLDYFLVLMKEAPFMTEQIVFMSKGAIIAGLNSQTIKNLVFPLPSVDEQKAILSYLSDLNAKFDKTRGKVESQIQTLQTLRSTLIAHAVTGKIKI